MPLSAFISIKTVLREFLAGKEEYFVRRLWFKAAQKRTSVGILVGTTAVNTGEDITDDVDAYFPDDAPSSTETPQTIPTASQTESSTTPPPIIPTKEELIAKSRAVVSLSGKYAFGAVVPFVVHSYELISGEIKLGGESAHASLRTRG
jgi:hypothetical protein